MFQFLGYEFNSENFSAEFHYQGIDGIKFTETVEFAKPTEPLDDEHQQILDRALFLAFILIGTSYYKAHPTTKVILDTPLDQFQADFFNQVYQEGLSQYAYENGLKREDLAHFEPTENYASAKPIATKDQGILSLQSGGKDSLLTATLLTEKAQNFTAWYLSSSKNYPAVLDQLGAPLQIATRHLDTENLKKSAGLTGHVPITYIVQSLALVQAILNHDNIVLTSIGQEGNEPHAFVGDLPVNHQWSKTWSAEQNFAEYVHRYISPNLEVGSPLRGFTELAIAEKFVEKCWDKYGHLFSSCNVANYKQQNDNTHLAWCGKCAKCANSYLLFAPFLPPNRLQRIFAGQDLFASSELVNDFKGLLGVDDVIKPFECVGEIPELRLAYEMRQPGYADLPFAVPKSDFDYRLVRPTQKFVQELFR